MNTQEPEENLFSEYDSQCDGGVGSDGKAERWAAAQHAEPTDFSWLCEE